ncbi:hypothetical protein AB0B51_33150 [Streptomyces griseus]|uniref:hypothetical protein n=1 Tax=Streptomyces griseus TaxID=1911 RepID=UPI0004C5BB66|nr:hypothetical protein [Streptomyces griseus]
MTTQPEAENLAAVREAVTDSISFSEAANLSETPNTLTDALHAQALLQAARIVTATATPGSSLTEAVEGVVRALHREAARLIAPEATGTAEPNLAAIDKASRELSPALRQSRAQLADEAERCPECTTSLAIYPDDELVYWRQDPRPFCSGECAIEFDARRNAADVYRRAWDAVRKGDRP